MADTTGMKPPSGRQFLAEVLDLYTRMYVAWAISAVNDRHLVLRAAGSTTPAECERAASERQVAWEIWLRDQGKPRLWEP